MNAVFSWALKSKSSWFGDNAKSCETVQRSAIVRGDLRDVGVPQYCFAHARVCITSGEARFLRISGKKGSS